MHFVHAYMCQFVYSSAFGDHGFAQYKPPPYAPITVMCAFQYTVYVYSIIYMHIYNIYI